MKFACRGDSNGSSGNMIAPSAAGDVLGRIEEISHPVHAFTFYDRQLGFAGRLGGAEEHRLGRGPASRGKVDLRAAASAKPVVGGNFGAAVRAVLDGHGGRAYPMSGRA